MSNHEVVGNSDTCRNGGRGWGEKLLFKRMFKEECLKKGLIIVGYSRCDYVFFCMAIKFSEVVMSVQK